MVRRANRKNDIRHQRLEKSIMLIALEGSNKTEKNYFRKYNRISSKFRVVFAHGNSTDPVNIVKDAFYSFTEKELSRDAGDRAYAVFDTDFKKEEQIVKARLLADKHDVDVILSNPCFEIWLLLHFRYTSKSFGSNAQLVAELQNEWPDYSKNTDSFNELDNRRLIAIEHARQLRKFHEQDQRNTALEKCNPSTDIDKLVELLTNDED